MNKSYLKMVLEFLYFALASTCVLVSATKTDPVDTKYGAVQGNRKEYRGEVYEEYLGIPFAAPPIGDLRWQKPVAPKSWEDVLETTAFGSYCTQVIKSTSEEDCLFLNVYVPETANAHKSEKLPVMVWIHGGAFFIGTSGHYLGYELALKGRVIVVTINYRLSSLGFLSTLDENAPGNDGLWDQLFALQWVQDNIANFGGDSSRVTIFGQSAGSASVSHLTLSPQSKGLFQRAILLSGSSNAYWSTTGLTLPTVRTLATYMGCIPLSNRIMMNCLRNKEADDLDWNGLLVPVLLRQHIPNWVPSVDGPSGVVPMKSNDAMEAGNNADLDLIIGYTNDDGAMFAVPKYAGISINLAESRELLKLIIKFLLNVYSNRDQLEQLIYEAYPAIEDDVLDVRTRALVDLVTDFLFAAPAHYEAFKHSETTKALGTGRRTYVYEFRHSPGFFERPEWLGAIHADDINYVFGEAQAMGRMGKSYTADDQLTSNHVIAYYSNFAYTGNPNDGPHSVSLNWPEYEVDDRRMLIQNPLLTTEDVTEEILEKQHFWHEVFFKTAVLRGDDDSSYNGRDQVMMMGQVKTKLEWLKAQIVKFPEDHIRASSLITDILMGIVADLKLG